MLMLIVSGALNWPAFSLHTSCNIPSLSCYDPSGLAILDQLKKTFQVNPLSSESDADATAAACTLLEYFTDELSGVMFS